MTIYVFSRCSYSVLSEKLRKRNEVPSKKPHFFTTFLGLYIYLNLYPECSEVEFLLKYFSLADSACVHADMYVFTHFNFQYICHTKISKVQLCARIKIKISISNSITYIEVISIHSF